MCFALFLSQFSSMLYFIEHVFVWFFFNFCLFFLKKKKKKLEKLEKYKNSVCFVYIGTCVPWMAIETEFSKLCIICNLDEHLYAQLSK